MIEVGHDGNGLALNMLANRRSKLCAGEDKRRRMALYGRDRKPNGNSEYLSRLVDGLLLQGRYGRWKEEINGLVVGSAYRGWARK